MKSFDTEMAGTERTFEYVVLAATPKGRLGVRDLGEGTARVRVEPTQANDPLSALSASEGWKQPSLGYPRHSIVTHSPVALAQAIVTAVGAIF